MTNVVQPAADPAIKLADEPAKKWPSWKLLCKIFL